MVTNFEYLPRIADEQLRRRLAASGAVLVRGAKWCGKTSTSEQLARSVLRMQDPREYLQNIRLAEIEPTALLQGETPRLIDEWQMAPVLWDAVRYEVDRRHERGQFILTGSAVPANDAVMHTGTGRIARLTMRPMSLFESGDSTGELSLAGLFGDAISGSENYSEGVDASHDQGGASSVFGRCELTISDYAQLICRGGWPEAVARQRADRIYSDAGLPPYPSTDIPYDYLTAIIESDISRVDNVHRNPRNALALLRSLARNCAQQVKIPTISADMAGDGASVGDQTVSNYLNALRRIFVVEDAAAWSPRMRSKTALRTAPTRYFVDPSLAVAALGAGPERLLGDLEAMGFLFENLCVRDLRIYADAIGGEVLHFRDRNGLEADAIVQLRNGRWAGIEIKLGGEARIDDGAANLLRLVDRLDPRVRRPAFLMVLTGGAYAYRRDDGVIVAPIGYLGP